MENPYLGQALILMALPAAAGASILLVLCFVCHMQKGAKERQEIRRSSTHISMIWPNMADKLEGSITKKIKASNNAINYKDLFDSSVKQSSKIASAWRSAYPIKAFKWADHPHLVAEAVEHGWSTFAFAFANMDAPIPPKLWESCTRSSYIPDKLGQPELSWEVNGASSEYMQKIRLNPSLVNSNKREVYFGGLLSTVQSLQTTLPLPGPPLGPLSFPQESYYEITVFGSNGNLDPGFAELSHSSFNENEHAHLIASSKHRSCASSDVPPSRVIEINTQKKPSTNDTSIKESSISVENLAAGAANLKEDVVDAITLQLATSEQQIFAIGLAAGSTPPFRLPGSDTASIGFFSNGRIFMNGKEQKKQEGWQRRIWGPTTVALMPVIVGCGFDPSARRLFFTLNGEMVENIMLPPMPGIRQDGSTTQGAATGMDKSMEFTANPLFPTIGANYCVTVMVNFGQASFAYAAANAQRVPDPCFRRPQGGGKAAGEDSADLFSMGRIDSEWLAGTAAMQAFASPGRVNPAFLSPPPPSSSSSTSRGSSSSATVNPTSQEYSAQGDSELFEITLDSRPF
ncbi:hypothetical protein GOP47_0026764 [Adiantum capillus-veneris]|nr:hypothetical protein GOP47_0026764 [Adiantum capillus-veneris]